MGLKEPVERRSVEKNKSLNRRETTKVRHESRTRKRTRQALARHHHDRGRLEQLRLGATEDGGVPKGKGRVGDATFVGGGGGGKNARF